MKKYQNENCGQVARKAKVLQYHIVLFRSKKTYDEYVMFFAKKVMPLIKRLYPSLYDKWMKKWITYNEKKKQFANECLKEIQWIMKDFICKLEQRILGQLNIKILIDEIGEICCGNNEYILPHPFEIALSKFKELCYILAKLGHENIVADYAYIKYRTVSYPNPAELRRYKCYCGYIYDPARVFKEVYTEPILFENLDEQWVCPKCGEGREHFLSLCQPECIDREAYIVAFKDFLPSLKKLRNMDKILQEKQRRPWLAWEFLSWVEWSMNVSRDFFRKKRLGPGNTKKNRQRKERGERQGLTDYDVDRNINVIERRFRYEQIRMIGDESEQEISYKREDIEHNLDIILRKIGLNHISTASFAVPHSIYLGMAARAVENEDYYTKKAIQETIHLWLYVEWDLDVVEVFDLHKFKNISKNNRSDCNALQDFIEELIDESGSEVEGPTNASKALKRVGIKGVLEHILVENKKANIASFVEFPVLLEKKPRKILRSIAQYLERNSVGWE